MTLAPGTKAVIKPTLHGRHHTDKAFVEKWQDFPVEILRFDPGHICIRMVRITVSRSVPGLI
jgi:hypothetical protein